MNEQQAIKAMRNLDALISITESEHESVRLAINALEKQIAKKPTDISKVKDGTSFVGITGYCPCCKEIVSEIDQTFVCDCGQKLDWSVEE